MKKLAAAIIMIICTSILFASPGHSRVGPQRSTATQEYVLKAWQIADGDPDEWLWSIEDIPSQSSKVIPYTSGILYKSLSSPPLRERVSRLGAGTKLILHWGRG